MLSEAAGGAVGLAEDDPHFVEIYLQEKRTWTCHKGSSQCTALAMKQQQQAHQLLSTSMRMPT